MSRNRRAAHPHRPRPRQNVHSSAALLLLLHGVVGVHPLLAQERPDSTALPSYPTLATSREVAVASAGAGALLGGFLIPIDVRDVPASGLDPAAIMLSVDRRIVGNQSLDAANASDWTRNTAFLLPVAMAAFTGPGDSRWHRMDRRALIYGEAFLLTMGFTTLGKAAFSRPRPFNYLADDERLDDSHYDPTAERAFVSMPSGHASSAWTGSGLAITEFLLYEPEASGWAKAGVGFVGGALGASTAALRVQAGQHFPTDVTVGSLLGLSSGIAVPLLHRGATPLPSARAWLQASGGMLLGSVTGVLLSGAFF